MKISVIRIGNSRGIRIPKTVLEQCRIHEKVNLEVEGDTIIIKPDNKKPREGWEEAFKKMRELKEDELLIDDMIDLDTFDWEW